MKWVSILAVAVGLSSSSVVVAGREASSGGIPAEWFRAMEWRSLGPSRGGRVTAVAGVPGEPHTFFFGASGGGVWKTEDAGHTWRSVSDPYFRVGSIGSIAIAPSDVNVIYVGTGEGPTRGQTSTDGDGLYKSTDGGLTWSPIGLEDAGRIPRIRVHPGDADIVYVAAQGRPSRPGPERGIYRSRDGGRSWERVLHVDDNTGAVDLTLDPVNPRILYAALWEHRRDPWKMTSGGAGSGIYRSVDGGDTWKRLSQGLPQGSLGKIGVAVSPPSPRRVWALVEAEAGGLYRSDDAGESWQRVNDDRVLFARAWYFMRVYADPKDSETVYVLNVDLMRSIDGGESFETVRTPHADHHDLWISSENSAWMVNGNDGGANVSLNGGKTWSRQDNQPTGQFYRVATDDLFPYRVYGCQQDASCLSIAIASGTGASAWNGVGGGESGFVAFDPDDPTRVYAGANMNQITEYDARTGEVRNIMAYPVQGLGLDARDLRYRFQWNAPIAVSPHDPRMIYHAAQMVLRSEDRGFHWVPISPDLTRDQDEKQGPGGGPIMGEAAGGEYYNTLSYLVESPHEPGTIWVSSDDGLVHLTRDGGGRWENVTPDGLPEAKINAIEVSPHDPASAYLAVTRFLLGDPNPYLFATSDYGKSWRSIAGAIPEEPVRVVREDPERRGLLYAGTERGVYVSFDDGAEWRSLKLDLPAVPVTDLASRRGDLVASTEGRGFWILEDLSPLQQVTEAVTDRKAHLFTPRKAFRAAGGALRGAMLYYHLAEAPGEELRLEIEDATGNRIRSFASPPRRAGLNRLVWDLRHEDAVRVPGTFLAADFFGTVPGRRVPPGSYRVELVLGDVRLGESLEVASDPRVQATAADFQEQEELLAAISRSIDEIHRSIAVMRRVRDDVESAVVRAAGRPAAGEIEEAGDRLEEAITRWEEKLIQTKLRTIMDAVNFPTRLNEQFLFLKGAVGSADSRPTASERERFEELEAEWTERREEMKLLLEEVARFNDLLRRRDVPAVVPPRSRTWWLPAFRP